VSEVSDVATVRLLIADYATVDPAGKLTVVGAGITALLRNPTNPDLTTPFWVAAAVTVPPTHYNSESSFDLLLEDSSGNPVSLPGLMPPGSVVRISQDVTFKEPSFQPPIAVPAGIVPSRVHWVVAFSAGLPLTGGELYAWRVKIDGETDDTWTEQFFVTEP
jgi:hypothetical protein